MSTKKRGKKRVNNKTEGKKVAQLVSSHCCRRIVALAKCVLVIKWSMQVDILHKTRLTADHRLPFKRY